MQVFRILGLSSVLLIAAVAVGRAQQAPGASGAPPPSPMTLANQADRQK
jgi:hypothetical protein